MELAVQMKVGDLVRYDQEYTSNPNRPIGIITCVHPKFSPYAPLKVLWSDHESPGQGTRRLWYSDYELELINESR